MNIIEAAKKYVRIRRGSWKDQQDFISRITIWDAFQFSRDNSTAGVSAEMLLADDWEEYREPELTHKDDKLRYFVVSGADKIPDHILDVGKKVSAWKKFTDEKPNTHERILLRLGKYDEPTLGRYTVSYESLRGAQDGEQLYDATGSLRLDQSQYEWTEIPE